MIEVQRVAAVVLEVDQLPTDQIDVPRLAVRRQAHQFVLAGIDLEATELRERRVEQAERVRKQDLAQELELVPAADAPGGGRPFADAVDREHRSLVERRRKKSARCMALVVFGEQHAAIPTERVAHQVAGPELVPKPGW